MEMDDLFESSNCLQINLFGFVTTTVDVDSSDPLSSINRKLGIDSVVYIRDGQVLNESLPFDFFDIKDGDSLQILYNAKADVPVPDDTFDMTERIREHFNKNWASHQLDPEAAFERYKMRLNAKVRGEKDRLNDLSRQKAESTPAGFRKMAYKFAKDMQDRK